jgi:hypothetical protein
LVVGCDDHLSRALLKEFAPLKNQGDLEKTQCPPNSYCTPVDPVSKKTFPINDLQKALCMGGIYALSTVLP